MFGRPGWGTRKRWFLKTLHRTWNPVLHRLVSAVRSVFHLGTKQVEEERVRSMCSDHVIIQE